MSAVAAGLLALGYRPARNLFSRRQAMNRSYDPFHLVNAYGAFGSVGRVRYELVVEGTGTRSPTRAPCGGSTASGASRAMRTGCRASTPLPSAAGLDDVVRRAVPAYARSWFLPFVERLLAGDRDTLRLLAHNPFPDAPPAQVRARLFHYRFTTRAERRATGAWWHRTPVREFLAPTRLR
ncbi:lipase maturation factor family protein [Streptomyces zhihengii]